MAVAELKAFTLLIFGISLFLMVIYFFTDSPMSHVPFIRMGPQRRLVRIVDGEVVFLSDSTTRPHHEQHLFVGYARKRFVLNTSVCFVPEFNPHSRAMARYFHKQAPTCHKSVRPFLFSTKLVRHRTCPSIRDDVVKEFYPDLHIESLKCFYQEFVRSEENLRPDIDYDQLFPKEYELGSCPPEEHIWLQCTDKSGKIYEQPLLLPKGRPARVRRGGVPSFNVLVIGIDALSRLNFLRQMNETRHWLENHFGVVEMFGYNKIGENSAPNQISLLTGVSYVPDLRDRVMDKYFDNITEYLWDFYRKHGFSTMFLEEQWSTGIFVHPFLKGFKNIPTDYWPRPLMQKIDASSLKRLSGEGLCLGGQYAEKLYLQYITDALGVARYGNPLFAYAWFSELSRDHINGAHRMDPDFLEFFKQLDQRCLLQETVILFISSHGSRLEEWRRTTVGKYEDMLPFFYAILPPKMVRTRPEFVHKLLLNSRRLLTVYDIHATLRELATPWTNLVETKQWKGISLISREVPENRTCSDAGINLQFCSCLRPKSMSIKSPLALEFADFVVRSVNSELARNQALLLCHLWLFMKIDYVAELEDPGKKFQIYKIRLRATPASGAFEASAMYHNGTFTLQSRIERLDWYRPHAKCVQGKAYARYCYCR